MGGICGAWQVSPKYASSKDRLEEENAARMIQARYRGNTARRKSITTTTVNGRTTWRGQEMINEYKMMEFLGKGSFGVVRKCKDTKTGKCFAMKKLSKPMMKRKRIGRFSTALEFLTREVAVWKKLKHENICRLVEVINDPEHDDVYLISEFVAGGTLLEDTQNPDPLPEILTVRFIRQVVAGLLYMHKSAGVAHRDIKPGNILVSERTVNGIAKITDFGVSEMYKDKEEEKKEGDLDLVHNTVGTIHFFSPEMLSEEPFHAYAADVWALGVTLYMCITGVMPFRGKDHYSLIRAITSSDGADFDMRCFQQTYDKGVVDLLQKMLEVNAADRISLEQVAGHPWITGSNTASPTPAVVPTEVIEVTSEEIENAITKVGVLKAITKFKSTASTRDVLSA